MNDVLTVLWKELKEAPLGVSQGNRTGGFVILFTFLFLFGVIYPSNNGISLFENYSFILLAASGAFFAAAAAPDTYAGERERRTLETLLTTRLSDAAIAMGKIGACVLFGSAASFAVTILAAVTVAVKERSIGAVPLDVVAFALALALLLNILVSAAGVIASALAHTSRHALHLYTLILMVTMIGPAVVVRSNQALRQAIALRLASSSSDLALFVIAAVATADLLLIAIVLLICRRPVLLTDAPR